MTCKSRFSRRDFVRSAAATALAGSLTLDGRLAHARWLANPGTDADVSLKGRIFKTLKVGMVGEIAGTLTDKFEAAKQAGFHGIEMNSPGMNVDDTKKAIDESGLPVDGTVCSTHWNVRHTSPNADVRKKALEHLEQAIRDTHAVGGHSVLLVAGKGEDGAEAEIWPRAVENIAQAVPLAAEKGVHIVIENVWNQFMYDHQGGADQTADKFVKFIDEFESPWVGMQFDIGNHWKYGSMGDWIRQLGTRIHKLDLKGFSERRIGSRKSAKEILIGRMSARRYLRSITMDGRLPRSAAAILPDSRKSRPTWIGYSTLYDWNSRRR
jgi:L-ribulose-5-phosphate 3-epimerase